MTPAEAAFWAAFRASGAAPADADARFHSAFAVGEGSDAGAALVISGAKTLTSWHPSEFPANPPRAGSLSILLGSGGRPRAVVETVRVWPMTLEETTEAHAAAYAEWPDLASFRAGMMGWYRRADLDFGPRTPLMFEWQRVVWAP
jgi:uncharacterized protein YhfF